MALVEWLTEKAVYWGKPVQSPDDVYSYITPVEVNCKWIFKVEKIVSPTGAEIVSVCQVIVDRLMDVGGYLYRGTYDTLFGDSSSSGDSSMEGSTHDSSSSGTVEDNKPHNIGAYEIKAYMEVTNKSGSTTLRKVWL
jgi:hypothetical protein